MNIKSPVMILCLLSIILHALFFFTQNNHSFMSITHKHMNLAYQFYTSEKIGINGLLKKRLHEYEHMHNKLANLHEIDLKGCDYVDEPFPVNDTIGYGILLGILWKFTYSLCLLDIQLLQIVIAVIMSILMYWILEVLFKSKKIAFWLSMGMLLYFPALSMTVTPLRDIWAMYGLIALLYGMIAAPQTRWKYATLCVSALFFSLCQWIRSSLVCAIVTIPLSLFFFSRDKKQLFKHTAFVICVNVCVFWLPFMALNKITYDRYFVSPTGQDMLEGMGEFANRWNFKLSDVWIEQYIENKYGTRYGSPEFDEAALHEFFLAVTQSPLHFLASMGKRIYQILLPNLPWIHQIPGTYNSFLYFISMLFIRLLLLMGYGGLFLLGKHKRYDLISLFCLGIGLASLTKFPSHIEYRYLVPFYWFFAAFAGYFLYHMTINQFFYRFKQRLMVILHYFFMLYQHCSNSLQEKKH